MTLDRHGCMFAPQVIGILAPTEVTIPVKCNVHSWIHAYIVVVTRSRNSNSYLDAEMRPINLSGQQGAGLVAILESLTGEIPPDAGPPETTPMGHPK